MDDVRTTAAPAGRTPPEAWGELGRAQRAAVAAGAALAVDWATLLARWGEDAGRALTGLATSRRGAPDSAAALLSAYQRYLAGVADLPRIAGLRFYAELERLRATPPG
jgi:hypothetical protein